MAKRMSSEKRDSDYYDYDFFRSLFDIYPVVNVFWFNFLMILNFVCKILLVIKDCDFHWKISKF